LLSAENTVLTSGTWSILAVVMDSLFKPSFIHTFLPLISILGLSVTLQRMLSLAAMGNFSLTSIGTRDFVAPILSLNVFPGYPEKQ
jgi:hypothetical protein